MNPLGSAIGGRRPSSTNLEIPLLDTSSLIEKSKGGQWVNELAAILRSKKVVKVVHDLQCLLLSQELGDSFSTQRSS
jgi:hypothetical protein